jgi:hypothetical protein
MSVEHISYLPILDTFACARTGYRQYARYVQISLLQPDSWITLPQYPIFIYL